MQNAEQDGNSNNMHGERHVLNFQTAWKLMFGQIRHSRAVCPLSDLRPVCAEDNNSPSGDMLR